MVLSLLKINLKMAEYDDDIYFVFSPVNILLCLSSKIEQDISLVFSQKRQDIEGNYKRIILTITCSEVIAKCIIYFVIKNN